MAVKMYVILYLLLSSVRLIISDGQNSLNVNYTIVEEMEPNTHIGNIKSGADLEKNYEEDVLQKLQFKFLDASRVESELFKVDLESGVLETATKIDRDKICPAEETCTLSFDVAVQPTKYFQVIKVTVIVRDLNDNDPHFPKDKMSFSISESSQIGATFPIPLARDRDSPANGVSQYILHPKSGLFGIKVTEENGDILDLMLEVKQPLDRETEQMYSFQLEARDKGTPSRSGKLAINIAVVDANDNKPAFNRSNYRFRIAEDIPIGSVVGRVFATDKDYGINGLVAYGFMEHTLAEHNDTFGINADTGEIVTRAALDYETKESYTLSIRAFDKGQDSLSSFTKATIAVLDVNDNRPEIKVNTLPNKDVARVMENQHARSFVAHLAISDKDSGENSRVSCMLDNMFFEIHQMHKMEFKLLTARPLDRETSDRFWVVMRCHDNGRPQLSSEQEIVVHVLDENDNGPRFLHLPYIARVHENNRIGVPVINVTATDADSGQNGLVRYRLRGGSSEDVTLDHLTGLITTKVAFNYENRRQIDVAIIAYDGGSKPRSSTATVTIVILDRNDETPIFQQSSYTFDIKENRPAGTEVGKVNAADPDSPPFNRFHFSVDTSNEDGHRFYINPDSGNIRTRTMLDRESQTQFDIIVVATEMHAPYANSTTKVKIIIIDVNDNSPIIDFPNPFNNTKYVPHNIPARYKFAKIVAHDDDTGENARLTYDIPRDQENGTLFKIDHRTGALYFRKHVPKFEGNTLQIPLKIKVHDNGVPYHSAQADMMVVLDRSLKFVPPLGIASSHNLEPFLSQENFIIIISVSAAFGLLIFTLVIVLVMTKRKTSDMRHGDYRYCGTSRVEVRLLNPDNKGEVPPLGTGTGWVPSTEESKERTRSSSFLYQRGSQTENSAEQPTSDSMLFNTESTQVCLLYLLIH